MSVRRRSRDPLMGLIALVLAPLLSGCFNLGFPGGGVNVAGGPLGGSVNVGFPGGGVNVSAGAFGGGVSVVAPGVNLNLGLPGRTLFYNSGDYAPRSQRALFPPPVQRKAPPRQVPPVAQGPPMFQGPPAVLRPPPVGKLPPSIAPKDPSSGLPGGWVKPDEVGFGDLISR